MGGGSFHFATKQTERVPFVNLWNTNAFALFITGRTAITLSPTDLTLGSAQIHVLTPKASALSS